MEADLYSTWNAPPSIPLGDSPPSNEMPQTGGARGMADLNLTPEDQGITEEPSNPQHGTSNSEEGLIRPEHSPPDINIYRISVSNGPPKPFFRGKITKAIEGMKKFLVRIRRRSKPNKEGGMTKRKYNRLGKPKSENGTKRK